MTKVKWFRDAPEERNDWLRFGLMELAAKKIISYAEWDLKEMTKFGFSSEILSYQNLRHLSFLLVEDGQKRIKCIIDNEDSFALFSELIVYADVYFCAGYNSDLFERRSIPKFYGWQTSQDVNWYIELLSKKIPKFESHFHKVKKFIPIGPNLWKNLPTKRSTQFVLNIQHRIRKALRLSNSYRSVHHTFRSRYRDLTIMRNKELNFDITLSDTSWGWPNHRIKLHQKLKQLSEEGFVINSLLKLASPSISDNSISLNLNEKDFPMKVGEIVNYEKMLASSKLGVFACGYHWGWRNIMTLGLFLGIPLVTDRLLVEAYFDMNIFKFWEVDDENWELIGEKLKKIKCSDWKDIKGYNQSIFDKWLGPEVVATYFITRSLA